MSFTLRAPSRAGSTRRSARGSISAAISVLVVMLVVIGGLSLLTTVPRPSASGQPSSALAPAAGLPFTHGDLNVTAGQTFVIQPTAGTHTYYQGGNITVFSGGTLIVRNVTLSFVQFVSDVGTAQQRLSHIYRFVDQAGGTVNFYNSTLTTDVQVINAWAKLNLTVEGTMTAWNSTLSFPGWIDVHGTSGDLTLNSSAITANPAVAGLTEPSIILGDTEYAASISVTGGAQLNAFASTISDTYADNTIINGPPAPTPLTATVSVSLAPGDNPVPLTTTNDSTSLSEDWLYPQADFQGGNASVTYYNPNGSEDGTAQLYAVYDGVSYLVGGLVFQKGQTNTLPLQLPGNLLQSVTADGVLNYLNWTGVFNVAPSRISLNVENYVGPPNVVVLAASLSFVPSPDYNLLVSGAGSSLNSIDTSFGLTWSALPASPTSRQAPYPWDSNKLLVTEHAVASLANATVTSSLPGVFSYSAVLPNASGEAVFYRWAQFNLTGQGGSLPIPEAQASAYYAYSTNQTDNSTANTLNDLAMANPAIWGYVQYWDAQHGITTGYGQSNGTGVASLLLASSILNATTVPDGFFLGSYHVGIVVPWYQVGDHWLNWSVSPYPQGVAQQPPYVAGPDFGPAQNFPKYTGAVIASITVLTNGVPSTTVNLGQTLEVEVAFQDNGSAKITQVQGELFYNDSGLPSAFLASYENANLSLTVPGQLFNFTFNWTVTDNVTGLFHTEFSHNLTIVLAWKYVERSGGGNLSRNVSLTFMPTNVTIGPVTVLANGVESTDLYLGQTIGVRAVVNDVGYATITAITAWLYYNDSGLPGALLAPPYVNTSLDLSAPGQSATFTISWVATANVTGEFQRAFQHDFILALTWNNNSESRWLGNGSTRQAVPVTFAPTVVVVRSTELLANGVANSTVELGQILGVQVVANDSGNGTITAISAWLYYNTSGSPTALLATYESTSVDLSGPGQSITFTLSWKATENVTGLRGWFQHNLTLELTWNNNSDSRWLGNGSLAQNVSAKFAPSEIRFVTFTLPPQTIYLDESYLSSGLLEYNGSHAALIELLATPVGGGVPVVIAATTHIPGNFSMPWLTLEQQGQPPVLTPGTTYTLKATATYNNRSTNDTNLGTISVPPTPSSSTNFFLQKFLGLPLWVWIAIAAAAAIAIVLFLFVVRRQAAGKLVECGECGNLIPEDATVCPKCGAEFESDLIRCSRCASTIPADSKFCPECAAQLLGTPGEAASDPEKQAYTDFTEKFRAEAKRELGDNYSEGAFWDWWKRQPTYTPFSQWSLQQGQGTARAGMTAPPAGTETTPETEAGPKTPPKGGGPGWVEGSTAPAAPAAAVPTTPPAAAGLKACPNCAKEIPSEYLVCPFCNAVTS